MGVGAYGRALADVGNYSQALDVLGRAHTPDQPDWRILSVQGAVLDQMGRHEEAQRYYATALRIVPDEPTVLSNLGLSYALSKDLVRAEATLRRASAQPRVDPRVRQNLALVIGLQGRFAEAENIAQTDLPSDEAAANVAYLRQMLAQQNGWKQPGQPGKPVVRPQGS
jgi:Flp pilus assembly protein TadD